MKSTKIARRENMGYVYILPWLIGFLIFQLYPLVSSFFYSFTDYAVVGKPVFSGVKNFVIMFTTDQTFFITLLNTLKYVFISVPAKLVWALVVAIILNQKVTGINVYRTVYYIPSIFGGSVAISILWRFLFMESGFINRVLAVVHIAPVPWLSSPKIALFTLSLLSIWQFGSSMVLFLAALKQVPLELYESAKVDGARRLRIFFRITLPLITPVLFFNLLMQIINAFQDFTGAFVITRGGPQRSTYLYALKLYDEAFGYYRMGYSCALSWVLFVFIMIFTAVFFRFSSMATYYEDGGNF